MLNQTGPVTSQGLQNLKRALSVSSDSAAVATNPALAYFKQQIALSEASTRLERSRLLPDITLGYFNQSLYGTVNYSDGSVAGPSARFQGVTAGISIPLWAKPQLSRIKANEALQQVAEANYDLYEKNLQGEYEQAYQEYLKYSNSLQYYEQNALPTAVVITQNAWQSYRSGDIGYMELSQGLNRALSIQMNYLTGVSQYNQSVINIEFLIGTN